MKQKITLVFTINLNSITKSNESTDGKNIDMCLWTQTTNKTTHIRTK